MCKFYSFHYNINHTGRNRLFEVYADSQEEANQKFIDIELTPKYPCGVNEIYILGSHTDSVQITPDSIEENSIKTETEDGHVHTRTFNISHGCGYKTSGVPNLALSRNESESESDGEETEEEKEELEESITRDREEETSIDELVDNVKEVKEEKEEETQDEFIERITHEVEEKEEKKQYNFIFRIDDRPRAIYRLLAVDGFSAREKFLQTLKEKIPCGTFEILDPKTVGKEEMYYELTGNHLLRYSVVSKDYTEYEFLLKHKCTNPSIKMIDLAVIMTNKLISEIDKSILEHKEEIAKLEMKKILVKKMFSDEE